jgi:hypothetical protein
MGWACSTAYGRGEKWRTKFGNTQLKRLLQKHRCRWDSNVKMGLGEQLLEIADGFVPQRPVAAVFNTVMNLRFP